jgi:hypothetical protein
MLNLTQALLDARHAGVTREQAIADVAPDGDMTRSALIWYVYDANADGRVPPWKIKQVVARACESSQPNALTSP